MTEAAKHTAHTCEDCMGDALALVAQIEAQERLVETLTRELANTEEKLQALNWHRINRTVNGEIFADLIKSAIDDIRTALAQARKG